MPTISKFEGMGTSTKLKCSLLRNIFQKTRKVGANYCLARNKIASPVVISHLI